MIGFNGKYLSAAAIGDMRITAMSQGDKWLLGSDWLLSATKAAILSAFGAEEGAGVIQATNAYLNAIAATDREKAQALAGFINEDPMLVCSIVETSKTRWLVGDGKAYVDTGVKLSELAFVSGAYIKLCLQWLNFSTNGYQVNGWGNNPQIGVNISNGKGKWQNYATGTEEVLVNTEYEVTLDLASTRSVLYCDGYTPLTAGNNTASNDYPFLLGCMTTNGTDRINPAIISAKSLEIKGASLLRHLIPHLHGGVAGMLDLVSLDFYPNANTEGAFTIQLTDKQ